MYMYMLNIISWLLFRHLTQFEELELLKEFEKRETNFTTKYRTKKKERGDLEVKVLQLILYTQNKKNYNCM